jgi:hypothetical protein
LDDELHSRPEGDTLAERRFLGERLVSVEKDMGRLAARLGAPTPGVQEMDALDRARELLADLRAEVSVRPLDEAMSAHLAWLDRAQADRSGAEESSLPALDMIDLDRRILTDLQRSWRARAT